jgi:NADPH:quinone reductase-like Zn-dependent oxidoreductase
MKAVRIHQYGGPEVLQLEEAPKPNFSENEVLIKVKAAGVNPVDFKIREGYLAGMLNHTLPLTLGWDVAGIIEAIGSKVKDWKIGDEIYSRPDITKNGAYAEYIAISANEIARKPKSLSFTEAAGVPLVALTAWQAIIEGAGLKAGQKVLIHAGSGGVGSFAIQFAKHIGATVLATSSTTNLALLKSLGADIAIDYTKDHFEELADKVDVVFDTIGGDVQKRSWQCLKPGGTLVSIASTPDAELAKKFQANGKFVFVQPDGQRLAEFSSLFDQGKLRVLIDTVFDLSEVQKAHELSQTGRARGKIILEVD